MFWKSIPYGYSILLDYRIWIIAIIFGYLSIKVFSLGNKILGKSDKPSISRFYLGYFIISLLETYLIVLVVYFTAPLLIGGPHLMGMVSSISFVRFLLYLLIFGLLVKIIIRNGNGAVYFLLIGESAMLCMYAIQEIRERFFSILGFVDINLLNNINILDFVPSILHMFGYIVIAFINIYVFALLGLILQKLLKRDFIPILAPIFQALAALTTISMVTAYTKIEIDNYMQTKYDSQIYYKNAKINFDKADYLTAISSLDSGLINNHRDSLCLHLRALAKMNIRNDTGAINDFTKLIMICPKSGESYCWRGIAHASINELSNALKDFSKAIALEPYSAEPYCYRGAIKDKSGDFLGALEDFNKAIELNPNYVEAYTRRGSPKFMLNNYSGAIEDYSKAIDLNPDYAEAYFCRGLLRIKLGNKENGLIDLNKSKDLGYNDAKKILDKLND